MNIEQIKKLNGNELAFAMANVMGWKRLDSHDESGEMPVILRLQQEGGPVDLHWVPQSDLNHTTFCTDVAIEKFGWQAFETNLMEVCGIDSRETSFMEVDRLMFQSSCEDRLRAVLLCFNRQNDKK